MARLPAPSLARLARVLSTPAFTSNFRAGMLRSVDLASRNILQRRYKPSALDLHELNGHSRFLLVNDTKCYPRSAMS
jgi:hypothetical protein